MTDMQEYKCENCDETWIATRTEWGFFDPAPYEGKFCPKCAEIEKSAFDKRMKAKRAASASAAREKEDEYQRGKQQEGDRLLQKWIKKYGPVPARGKYELHRNLRNTVGRWGTEGSQLKYRGQHPWTGIYPRREGGRCSGSEHYIWIDRTRALDLIRDELLLRQA